MPYHIWGEDTVDWELLYQGIDEIGASLLDANLTVIYKEKYGTMRCSLYAHTQQEVNTYIAIFKEIVDKDIYKPVRDELIADVDYAELIDPTVYNKYWKPISNEAIDQEDD